MCTVIVRPNGYDFKLKGLTVEVHFKLTPVQFPVLESDLFDKPRYLIGIGVKVQSGILEIIDGERVPVLIGHFLAAYTAYGTDTFRIYMGECILLVVVDDSVLVRIHINILDTVRQLKTAVPVTGRVNVTAASHRKQTGIELHVVSGSGFYGKNPFTIAEGKFLPMFTTAYINRHPVKPPFGTGRFSNLLQPLIAVGAFVVNDNVPGIGHLADFPVRCTHTQIDTVNNHGNMVTGRSSQGKDRFILPIDGFQHEETLDKALYAVQLDVILPFLVGFLGRPVFFGQPVTFTTEIHIVIDVKFNTPVQGKGKAEDVIRMDFLHLSTAVIHPNVSLLYPVAVVYGYKHILMVF